MEEIKKSHQNRKLATFICDNCGKEAEKPASELKRNLNLGRKNFCSRQCAAIYNNTHRHYPASEKVLQHLETIRHANIDEFTPFRYTLRNVKRRFKEVDIDLCYLRDLWESQKGLCPYTHMELILPTNGNIKDIPFERRASLDRIDSSLGYIKGNVQFVSTPINLMKSEMSDLQTKRFLKTISSYTSTFIED